MSLFRRLIHEEEAQDYVEYAVLIAVLVIGVAVSSNFIVSGITTYFNTINSSLSGASAGPLP